MHTIQTLGSSGKRTSFSYEGRITEGTMIIFEKSKSFISPEFYKAAIEHFGDKTVAGGFSMTDPTKGGFGEWIQNNSSKYGHPLTSRHASFIAAILVNEGYATSSLNRNAVILHFKRK